MGLNQRVPDADSFSMTVAPNHSSLAAVPPADTAVADVTALLPARDAVLARVAEQLPATDATPATLLVVGLLRRDDGDPIPQAALAEITTLMARSLRGDDWLGSSGPTEFAVVMTGPTAAAEAAAARLLAAVATLGVPALSAAAGLAPLTADLTAGEALRRALVSLTAARRAGAGTVIQHRQPY